MEKSDSIKALSAALVAFQGEVPVIPFDSKVKVDTKRGGSYEFSYASLTAIKEVCQPILAKNGLAVSQPITDGKIVTILLHSSGEYIASETTLPLNQKSAYDKTGAVIVYDGEVVTLPMTSQEEGSVITYMRRYAYSSMLGLVADEDDDGNVGEKNDVKAKEAVLPWLNKNTTNAKGVNMWKYAEEKLKSGEITVDEIKKSYKLSKANEEYFQKLCK